MRPEFGRFLSLHKSLISTICTSLFFNTQIEKPVKFSFSWGGGGGGGKPHIPSPGSQEMLALDVQVVFEKQDKNGA